MATMKTNKDGGNDMMKTSKLKESGQNFAQGHTPGPGCIGSPPVGPVLTRTLAYPAWLSDFVDGTKHNRPRKRIPRIKLSYDQSTW